MSLASGAVNTLALTRVSSVTGELVCEHLTYVCTDQVYRRFLGSAF